MLLAIKDRGNFYYCGAGNGGSGIWDKQLRKAKIYKSFKKAAEMRDDIRFIERETYIVSVCLRECGPYNPDLEI